jgi:hypothetical protein
MIRISKDQIKLLATMAIGGWLRGWVEKPVKRALHVPKDAVEPVLEAHAERVKEIERKEGRPATDLDRWRAQEEIQAEIALGKFLKKIGVD